MGMSNTRKNELILKSTTGGFISSGQESIQKRDSESSLDDTIPENVGADDIKHKFLLDQPDLKPCDYYAISEEGFCDLCMFLENADCHGHGWKALAERIGITPHPYILNIVHRAMYQRRSPAAIVLDFFFKDSSNNPLDALKNLSNICYKIDNLAAKELVDKEIQSIGQQMDRRRSPVKSADHYTLDTPDGCHPVIKPPVTPVESLGAEGTIIKPKVTEQRRKPSLRTSMLMSTVHKITFLRSSMKRKKAKANNSEGTYKTTEESSQDTNHSGQFNEGFVTDLGLGRQLGEIADKHGHSTSSHFTKDTISPPEIYIIPCQSSSTTRHRSPNSSPEAKTRAISHQQDLGAPPEETFRRVGSSSVEEAKAIAVGNQHQYLVTPAEPLEDISSRPDSGISDMSRDSWRSTCSHGDDIATTTTSPA